MLISFFFLITFFIIQKDYVFKSGICMLIYLFQSHSLVRDRAIEAVLTSGTGAHWRLVPVHGALEYRRHWCDAYSRCYQNRVLCVKDLSGGRPVRSVNVTLYI